MAGGAVTCAPCPCCGEMVAMCHEGGTQTNDWLAEHTS